MIDFKDLDPEDGVQFVESLGMEPFRFYQVMKWIYKKRVEDFGMMTDIPRGMRALLEENAYISSLKIHSHLKSKDESEKFSFLLRDGFIIESVFIPSERRNTVCISTQVGCRMGCSFCYTGKMGFSRNLTPAEIVNQILCIMDHQKNRRIHNIVIMGMGEPLDNFENLIKSLRIITHQSGLSISPRRITLSTCGILPKIPELLKEFSVNLAISLNASTNEKRNEIMPVNRKYPIDEIIKLCKDLPIDRRRRITFEYVLLGGFNDKESDARMLGKLLYGIRSKVNLIVFNSYPGASFKEPEENNIRRFQEILSHMGYPVTIRESRGRDIYAACGQLASFHFERQTENIIKEG